MKIDAAARSRLRSAITSHTGWQDYKRATGKGIADYQKEDYLAACHALQIDAQGIVDAAQTEGADMRKERTKDRFEVNALYDRFIAVLDRVETKERTKCDDIFRSIRQQGSGMATDAQYNAIDRIVTQAESTEQKAQTFDAAPAAQPVAAPPAASNALYDIMREAVRADLEPLVKGIVTRALDGVATVKIELQQQGATVGASDGHQHPMFTTLCRALSARQVDSFAPNVWIAGPAGSGKTHAAKTFASVAKLAFWYNGALSMPHELLGFIDAAGHYHRTPFREAFEHGGVYLFDEVDGSDNAALLALNAALANGRASFPDAQIERHKDCRIIATANTWGLGATADYVGRSKIDAAFLSRFPVRLPWDYDAALEVAISGNADFARRVQAARERARAAGLKVLIDPRATMAGAALIAAGLTHDEAASLTYLANLSPDQKKLVEGRA
jgi:cobaltochelatase CobS